MSLQYLQTTVISLFCVLALTSCVNQETQNGDSVFFDTRQFVTQQIEVLEQLNPSVQRTNVLNDQEEKAVLTDIDWANELALFVDADINKSSYIPSYIVEKPTHLTTTYTLKEGENLPVKFMQITLDSVAKTPTALVATLYRNNKLFDTEKNIHLTMGDYQGKPIVKEYQVQGYQKVLFLGTTHFSLKGIINLF